MGNRWGLGVALALGLGLGLALGPGAGPAAARGDRGGQVEPGMTPPYKLDTWATDEAVKIVPQAEGRYELRGDGVSAPYHWVWVPASGPPPKPVAPYGTDPPAARRR